MKSGDTVRLKEQPDKVGVIRDIIWNEQLQDNLCKVQFGTRTITLSYDVIEPLPEESDPWREIGTGSLGGAESFRALLTLERLSRPPSRIATCFGTARAHFLPYQFKPLLKLIDNPRWRILIADEVGLGKTIEAGYVLRELRARGHIGRVLVVVPARLRLKWKGELEPRFEERFEMPSTNQVRQFLSGFELGKEIEFNWIVSYEQVRPRDIQEKFDRLRPSIDLLIFDEGHRVRNPRTLQHKVARTLADCAEAMLILTATPLQTGPEDLFWLLHLLDRESFPRFDVFEVQRKGTGPLMDALSCVRRRDGKGSEAAGKLEQFLGQPFFRQSRQDPFVQSVVTRCRVLETLSRPERIELERDLARLSFTDSVLTRTLKRETQVFRPERTANSLLIDLSPEEDKAFEILGVLPTLQQFGYLSWGTRMAFAMTHRQAASCLPAVLERVVGEASLEGDSATVENEGMDWEVSEEPTTDDVPSKQQWREIENILLERLRQHQTINVDSKFAAFRRELERIWRDDLENERKHRKVVLFSFFKATLRYLSRKLRELGIGHHLIDGDVPFEVREERIEAFRDKDQIRVLLSSEVGSEGLDLQCASVLFNYDLPWNPMVVEQRIGRLDRIGQLSKRIVIINLVIRGSIEERILLRLYERIRLFQESIGELDPILGEQVQRIALEALTGELSEDELESKCRDATEAIERRKEEARHLERESNALVAADQAYLDEINALVKGRRMVQPADLAWMLSDFFRTRYPGSKLPARLSEGTARVHLQTEVASDLLGELPNNAETLRVAGLVRQGAFEATVNPEAAEAYRRVEFLQRRHPLVQFVSRVFAREVGDRVRSFALKAHVPGLKPGHILMKIVRFELGEPRPRTELLSFGYSFEKNDVIESDIAESILVEILGKCTDVPVTQPLREVSLESAKQALEDATEQARAIIHNREKALLRSRLARIRATQTAAWQHRKTQAARNLESLRENKAPDFPIRMAQARLESAERELKKLAEQNEVDIDVMVASEVVALALVQLTP